MRNRPKRRKPSQVKSDKPVLAAVNANIKRIREDRGIERDELARELGISVSAIYKWEEGHASPSITRLPAVAAALSTTVDELLAA